MTRRIFTVLVLVIVMSVFLIGCASTPPAPAPAAPAPAAPTPAPAPAPTPSPAPAVPVVPQFDGTITFGVVAAMTGVNSMVGEFVVNGANLAAKHINEAGGINGKELKLVFEDEVDNLQASVNATTRIINNPDVVALFGSTFSSNVIAASPLVQEKRITMFAGGSSANIPKQNNPYIWQVRMTDDYSGALMAQAAIETLNMTNPAILFTTDSFGTGLRDQTLAALQARGIEVPANQIFGFTAEERNFAPLLTQIQNSDADGLIAIAHQMTAALICQQVEAAGLDIPLLGSSSWASAVTRTNAGASANGWHAVADWTVEVTTPEGRAFAKAYLEEFGTESDMPAVTVYDSIMLFKEASEIANTTTDREAINNALKQIRDFRGAMSTYTYHDNRGFSTSQFLTLNQDGRATMVDIVLRKQN